jgi:hypothetical protein
MGKHGPRDKPTPPRDLAIVEDGNDVFIVLDGVQIAKRGHPGTLQAGTWISLEPGWSVIDNVGANELTVTFESVRIH